MRRASALHHARLTESIHAARIPVDDALSLFSSAGLSREQGLESINRLIEHQAYMLSANDLFAASALLCLLLTSIVWFARKTYAGAPADTGGAH